MRHLRPKKAAPLTERMRPLLPLANSAEAWLMLSPDTEGASAQNQSTGRGWYPDTTDGALRFCFGRIFRMGKFGQIYSHWALVSSGAKRAGTQRCAEFDTNARFTLWG